MNYEYISVDPRAIKMLGGDEQDLLNEGLDGDIISGDLSSDVKEPDLGINPSADFENKGLYPKTDLLEEILEELREIKTILAGK